MYIETSNVPQDARMPSSMKISYERTELALNTIQKVPTKEVNTNPVTNEEISGIQKLPELVAQVSAGNHDIRTTDIYDPMTASRGSTPMHIRLSTPLSIGPVMSDVDRIETPPLDDFSQIPPDFEVLSPPPISSPVLPIGIPAPFSLYNTYTPMPIDIRCYSQNVNKSNTVQHALLNDSLLAPKGRDLIFLQEPWYGKIGLDYERQSTETRSEKYGTVNNGHDFHPFSLIFSKSEAPKHSFKS